MPSSGAVFGAGTLASPGAPPDRWASDGRCRLPCASDAGCPGDVIDHQLAAAASRYTAPIAGLDEPSNGDHLRRVRADHLEFRRHDDADHERDRYR